MRLWQQAKNVYHLVQAVFWRRFFGQPDQALQVYGVTGTNGKTTTCYLLASMLAEAFGVDMVGMLTTVGIRLGTHEEINETKMTTLPSRKVFHYLHRMRQAGVKHVVIELTSHALDQHRVHGIHLAGAIILNVEREHLDYHYTMEHYATAKERIFDYLATEAPLVGKADDVRVQRMLTVAKQRGLNVHAFTAAGAANIETPLPGAINKENAAAATELARALGLSAEDIDEGLARVKRVPGRMEWIRRANAPAVIIDYAVTPDALERLYKEVRDQTRGRVFAVLGAAGLRDRGKRPAMARAAARYADVVILTREDPWTEPEEQIFSDLEKGLRDTTARWQRIPDRRMALMHALRTAGPGDTVVVTGKGAERGMAVGRTIIPWHDRTVILELLKSRTGGV